MPVTGYPDVTSALPGSRVHFNLSTDTPGRTNLEIFRLSAAAAPPSTNFQANLHTQPLPPNPWEGFGWVPAADTTFVVPNNWPTGLYLLRVVNGENVLSFVVRPAVPGSASRILFHVDFLTLAAYNPTQGKSLYGFNSGGEDQRAIAVSLLRDWSGNPDYGPPGTAKTGIGLQLIQWLENQDIAVEYCSSVDLHAMPTLLDSYDCLIVGGCGHDEYWTRAMRENTERFVANGGNLIVLGGNTGYRAVRFENNTRIVFYKYPAADPAAGNEDVTVAWADPPLNRPPNTLFGAGWTYGAFSGPNSAYTIRFPAHWVFKGLNDYVTTPFMNYETDAAGYIEEPEHYPRVSGVDGTPLAYTVLASADLRNWGGKPGFATMGLYSRNGTVFHAGTTDWIAALATDPVVNQITQNVFARLGQQVPWDWEDIGHANLGTALTSLNGRLFIATSQNMLWMRHPVGAEVVWRRIGHANNVIAMAGESDTLYCVTDDNRLWWRPPTEADVVWTAIGQGPPNARTLAAAGGTLYSTDDSGQLWRGPAQRAPVAWDPLAGFIPDPTVKAMTSYADILIASTDDNRLVRSPSDFASEILTPPRGWAPIFHCDFSIGLAVVEWMLFVATSKSRLWRLDLSGLRQP